MQSYSIIDQKIHQLCQVITKVNRSLVPKEADDSHTNLYFEPIEKRIYGRWFQQNDNNYILALDLVHFSFLLLADNKEIVKQFEIEGKTSNRIEEEITKAFDSLDLPTEGLMKTLHFEIPTYSFIDSAWNKADFSALDSWMTYRSMANEASTLLLGIAQVKSEVRIWPHHFDTGVYFKANRKTGVGFGLAMEDQMANDAYFYMAAYPENHTIQYTNLPEGGAWRWIIGDHWNGAILTLKELEGKSDLEKMDLLRDYIKSTYNWIIKQ